MFSFFDLMLVNTEFNIKFMVLLKIELVEEASSIKKDT
jgi:hypothetical protein